MSWGMYKTVLPFPWWVMAVTVSMKFWTWDVNSCHEKSTSLTHLSIASSKRLEDQLLSHIVWPAMVGQCYLDPQERAGNCDEAAWMAIAIRLRSGQAHRCYSSGWEANPIVGLSGGQHTDLPINKRRSPPTIVSFPEKHSGAVPELAAHCVHPNFVQTLLSVWWDLMRVCTEHHWTIHFMFKMCDFSYSFSCKPREHPNRTCSLRLDEVIGWSSSLLKKKQNSFTAPVEGSQSLISAW